MTSLDTPGRQRDSLPSISNLDFEKYRIDKADHNRYSMPGFTSFQKSALSSPPTTYSGPPPPYSSAPSVTGSTPGMAGYISPPESNSRRSTRDDKDISIGTTLLPSISEALKSADTTAPQQFATKSQPSSAVAQTFADAPAGPGNPFSQPPPPPVTAPRTSFSAVPEPVPTQVPPPPIPSDPRPGPSLHGISSPRSSITNHRPSGPPVTGPQTLESPFRSSFSTESARPGYPFPDFPSNTAINTPPTSNNFRFEPLNKPDVQRNPFVKPDPIPYNETVKRHLDVYDAEVALNEIHDASLQTLEFSNVWSQRYHQANRTSYFNDGLPGTTEIDDMIRYSHRIMEGLTRLRDVAIMQQNALDEQRARAARGQNLDDEYRGLSEAERAGGFAGGDAKKRRGKAAPPGRCHSCNRAETPEWRRGPDGARTLCNACGLHYAKLTRKMGANKAAVLTGSNLRPKSLTDTRPS